ncbi:MAG: restriction endonuclease subunit S [Magnetococcales bacterium]|nr:restriction endonuclease subunit S [Magnetococcales bacterium]NGZ26226.1 restriction endonuclease subunit S [Magnetococcales bacterium]
MSYPRYAEYKESGVEWLGEVPGHWEVKQVRYFAEILRGKFTHRPRNDPAFYDGDFPFIQTGDITGTSKYITEFRQTLNERGVAVSKEFPKGTLVMAIAANIGDVAIIDFPAYFPDSIVGLAPKSRSILMFMFYLMQAMKQPMLMTATVSTQMNLNVDQIASLSVASPSLSEQSAIATFLDRQTAKIDALVAEQEKLIGLLKEKRQAVISHAVTKGLNPTAPMKDSGIEWLGEVPEHWEVKRVKCFTKSIEQGWSPLCEGFPVESFAEWGVLKVGCVNDGIFNPLENKSLPNELEPVPTLGIVAGDLLISRANTRELVGSAAVVNENYCNLMLCDKLYRLRLVSNCCLPEFLSRYFGITSVRGQIGLSATGASSSMLNISQSTILELISALPSISEQQLIVRFLDQETSKIDTLITEAQQAITLLKERRSALISAAVTGKIDVRGESF